jgi:hypothetical protein
MSPRDLAALGKNCAERKSHLGITGMLLHKNGSFLQVIEGSKAVIRDMFARISADPRHIDIRTICDRTIPHREFAGHAVSFKNLDELPPGSPYLNPFSFEAFAVDPDLAVLILAYFFRNRLRTQLLP